MRAHAAERGLDHTFRKLAAERDAACRTFLRGQHIATWLGPRDATNSRRYTRISPHRLFRRMMMKAGELLKEIATTRSTRDA
jgi:hypothetical protein